LLIAATHSALVVYLLNVVAALTCFVLIGLVRAHHQPPRKERFSVEWLLGGFTFVFSTPIILGIMTLDLFAVLFGGAVALLPVYATEILHVGARGLGFLEAAFAIGSLSCGLLMAHRPPMQRAGRALLQAVIAFGIATIAFGLSTFYPLSLLMLFICGFTDNISVIVRHTLVQLLTPDHMRGRVAAVNSLFIGTSNELGGFESGAVAGKFGAVASVVSGGVGTILVVLCVGKMWPEVRNFGTLVSPESQGQTKAAK
jgi:MFS family permease